MIYLSSGLLIILGSSLIGLCYFKIINNPYSITATLLGISLVGGGLRMLVDNNRK